MRTLLIALLVLVTMSVAANDIYPERVDCSVVLKKDPVPGDMILAMLTDSLEESPESWSCMYHVCDKKHTEGWIAIKKDGTFAFSYDKKDRKTSHWYVMEDVDRYAVARVKFNWAGIRDADVFLDNEGETLLRIFIDALVAPVSRCVGK